MFSEKIDDKNILMNLDVKTKNEVIERLSEILVINGFISDIEQFKKDVFDRESHMTTGIGNAIAIPHGKSSSVIESTVIVAKLKQPIEWAALDKQPVNLVFLLAIKEADKGNEHLRFLAELSGKLMDDDFVQRLKAAQDKDTLIKALSF
ncbi:MULTISPECIES: fructose PTS transporter subunit IIA [unclassified Enterococcus]|uniref:PTS sugar transporter subunit IIA n=1 Tax=unclassified Enterococcus TaxID=2608891 RepID=UPI001557CA1F|nr:MULTISPECIES: fructose PTS transporter subunit IIA [unclassified Enterococcus]MBS7576711.1 fructose PTS transporter subunit IIA [Enterococcus sp. MMGLQ5-2]MBS7583802.1 fructose PTS transporter subunit IIA [Enterococcus sp. MMGLQ5-1]NPD11663.1 PTS transporter subunit EIIA [Enterococcus sp. MMGLQ5-1]NPD36548.1 PTS transporter subunit EIIA [Enterococcus sp. MMGLQ5-2]